MKKQEKAKNNQLQPSILEITSKPKKNNNNNNNIFLFNNTKLFSSGVLKYQLKIQNPTKKLLFFFLFNKFC